jgi:multidrug efflux system membrane fusion protein
MAMNASPPASSSEPTSTARLGGVIKWSILVSALIIALITYCFYEDYPRTDDASVTANVVGIAPRVSGPITRLAVSDNQLVKAGDLLFEIDPIPYQHAVEKAAAEKKQAEDSLHRLEPLLPKAFATQEQVDEAQTAVSVDAAVLATAQYDLEGCRVVAPFDGYITNLNISNGAFAHAAGEVITMVDIRNWYVIANFRESALRHIEPGMKAQVFLMTRPNVRYYGVVVSTGRGVVPEESPQLSGLPNVKRELNWVRLAQRFPVRIKLDAPPTDDGLRVGVTAIVTITGHGN